MTYTAPVTVPAKSVPFVRKLFPGYKRRDVYIRATEKVTFSDLNWSGGTRAEYTLVRLEDGAAQTQSGWNQIAPWANPYEGVTVELRPGFLIVENGHFCGKQSIMRIHVHPSNVTPLLT